MFEKQPHYKEILDSIQTLTASISKINSKAKGKSLKHFSLFYPNLFLCLRCRCCSIVLRNPHKFFGGTVFYRGFYGFCIGLLIIEWCLKYWKENVVNLRRHWKLARDLNEHVFIDPRVEIAHFLWKINSFGTKAYLFYCDTSK